MNKYEVAVLAPLQKTLTYSGPAGENTLLQPGQRVLVPLGKRLVTGYILGPAPEVEKNGFTVKAVREILDPEPVFPASIIPFYRWIADYYHYPIGEVIRTALPGGLSAGSGKRIYLVPEYRTEIEEFCRKSGGQDSSRMEDFLRKGELSPAAVVKFSRQPRWKSIFSRWEQNGWIRGEEEISRPQFAVRTMVQVVLSEALQQVVSDAKGENEEQFCAHCKRAFTGLKKSELKTLALLYCLISQGKGDSLDRPALTRLYAGAGKALTTLAEKNLLLLEEKRVYRDLFGQDHRFYPKPDKLTDEQENVLARIFAALGKHAFHTFLLHGVTGCGKTEVYLQATAKALEQNKNVLVLVPEIALTTQLEAHFYSRFGDRLALLHSGLSTGERHDQWQRVLTGKAMIVIGARSAVFAPIPDLGLIVVDEEHEPAYKQEDGLHYNARDLAVLRGKFSDCPVLLGSATPSVISYHHARAGKYELLRMERRVHDQLLPEVSIVNLTAERSRPDLFFSDQLAAALWENMENRQQSLLFVNRRGFATFMLCDDCGHIVQCRHCNVSLTLHRGEQRLVCHYCGYSISTRIICPDCGSRELKALGIGSERIEDEVRQVLPHARIARLDSDTASNRKHYLQTLKAVYQHEVDVLIGTQMIAKGLHFPNLTLVGVVWADSGLGIPDFRSSERTFQLLAQVTGRAGRGEHPGRVIIQTYHPEHYSVLHAQQHDYQRFYEQEIDLRRELDYPPFSRLVNVRLSAKDEKLVERCAKEVAAFLRREKGGSEKDLEVLGPAPAPLVRIRDRIRWQVIIKGVRLPVLHHLCRLLQERYAEICSGSVRMTIDVDPESMM